jgi:hypothetical protein
MVVVNKLNKATHFVPVKLIHKEANICDIYIRQIASLHGVPKTIVSHRDPKLTLNVWKGLFKVFGTNMNLSTTYHPNSVGETKMVNQVI